MVLQDRDSPLTQVTPMQGKEIGDLATLRWRTRQWLGAQVFRLQAIRRIQPTTLPLRQGGGTDAEGCGTLAA